MARSFVKFFSTLFELPSNHFSPIKLVIIIVLSAAYIFSFGLLNTHVGNGVAMLSLIPVLMVGLFFGQKLGSISGVIFQIINSSLFILHGIATLKETLTTGIVFGGFALLILGTMVGYMSDLRSKLIEELKSKENFKEELEEQKTRILEILNEQEDVVCRFTPQLHLTYINPTGLKFTEKKVDELIGNIFLELFTEKEAKFIQKFFEKSKNETKTIKFDFPLTKPSKEKVFFQWLITPLFDQANNLTEFQAVGRDITETVQAQKIENEQRRVIEALSNSAAILNSTLDINEVLVRVLENISLVVPHDAANIMLVKNRSAKMVHLRGYEKFIENMDFFKNLEFPVTLPNFHQMVVTGKSMMIPNTAVDPRWEKLTDNDWIGGYLGAPLIFKGSLIGFLNLDSAVQDFFQEKHLEWLQAFADQAAVAIKNAQLFEEAKERAKQFSLLNEAARIAINAVSLDEIKQPMAQLISHLFSTDYVQISIWDEKKLSFNSFNENTANIQSKTLDQTDINSRNILAQEIMASGKIKIYTDIYNNEELPAALREKIPLTTIIILPLVVFEQKLGFIFLGYVNKTEILQHEMLLLEQFARQTSLAISKTQLIITEKERRQKLSRTNQILSTITEIGANVKLDLNIQNLLHFIGERFQAINLDCCIALQNPGEAELTIQYSSMIQKIQPLLDSYSQDQELLRINFSKIPHYQELIEKKQSVFLDDMVAVMSNLLLKITKKPQDYLENINIQKNTSGLLMPLIVSEQTVGIILVWGNEIKIEDQSTLNFLAMQVETAIEKNKLYQKIQQLAITDSLTGLYNRRGLEELGKHEIERAIRFSRPLTVFMIDIDKFKKVNDTFGHPIGDEILVQLARLLQSKLREVDILSRYGGEEFFVMLPETNQNDAFRIAERLRSFIQTYDFATTIGLINITISIGICYLSKNIYTLDDMISSADQALYNVKNSGRNSINLFRLPHIEENNL